MAVELVLVGVVHRDPRGEARLRAFLESEAPAAVSLELSAPSVESRKAGRLTRLLVGLLAEVGRPELAAAVERGEPLSGRLGELAAGAQSPYELEASQSWARESGARIELLDDPQAAQRAIALVESELLTATNLRALLDEDSRTLVVGDPTEEQYALARRYFGNPQLFRFHFSAAEVAEMEARDAHVTLGLERLLGEVDGKIVHVAGWEHLVDGGLKTLFPRWKGRARRVLLANA